MIFRPSTLYSGFLRALAIVVSVAAFSACSLNVDVNDPSLLVKNDGDGQTGPVNTALPTPLSVLVATQFGAPLAGVPVNWSIIGGGGSLSQTSTVTTDAGTASVIYTTGATPGTAQIRAQVNGIPAVIFFETIT